MREKQSDLAQRLEGDLFDRYGPMVGGDSLRSALGYASSAAFRQALTRGTVPVPVFQIKHRRGKYALVKDVAQWLARQRAGARLPRAATASGSSFRTRAAARNARAQSRRRR